MQHHCLDATPVFVSDSNFIHYNGVRSRFGAIPPLSTPYGCLASPLSLTFHRSAVLVRHDGSCELQAKQDMLSTVLSAGVFPPVFVLSHGRRCARVLHRSELLFQLCKAERLHHDAHIVQTLDVHLYATARTEGRRPS